MALYIDNIKCTLACPEIRQSVQIFALIKPIGLCGTIIAQKNFGLLRYILIPPPSRVRFALANAYVRFGIANLTSELKRGRGFNGKSDIGTSAGGRGSKYVGGV